MIYKFNTIQVKFSAGFLVDIETLILKFLWKYKFFRRVNTTVKRKGSGGWGGGDGRVHWRALRPGWQQGSHKMPGVPVRDPNQQEIDRQGSGSFPQKVREGVSIVVQQKRI